VLRVADDEQKADQPIGGTPAGFGLKLDLAVMIHRQARLRRERDRLKRAQAGVSGRRAAAVRRQQRPDSLPDLAGGLKVLACSAEFRA